MAEPIPDHHFVSQVLLRRFADKSGRLQVFNVHTELWNHQPPKQVFCYPGYNQLLALGQIDESLELDFGKVESKLPATLEALEQAAKQDNTKLPVEVYSNLCWYCAFLWRISPFGKAKATVDFLITINEDLKQGKVDLLRDVLGLGENDIKAVQKLHSEGKRVILHAKDYIQLIYKIQCVQHCKYDFNLFRHYTKWTVYNSPVELPISDIALVQIAYKDLNYTVYLLPIAPNLLLVGTIPMGTQTRSDETLVYGKTLPRDAAQELADIICHSAQLILASKNVISDISEMRKRGASKVNFVKIANIQAVFSAGVAAFNGVMGLSLVDRKEYASFINSHLKTGDIYLLEWNSNPDEASQ